MAYKKKAKSPIEDKSTKERQPVKDKEKAPDVQDPVLVQAQGGSSTPATDDQISSNEVIKDGERQGKKAQEKTKATEETDAKSNDKVLGDKQPVTTVTSARLPASMKRQPPVDPTGKVVDPRIPKPPAMVGEVMPPLSKRSTVRLRYTGESPVRAVQGPLPSGAKYQIRDGFLVAYGVDVQVLLDRGDFEEVS